MILMVYFPRQGHYSCLRYIYISRSTIYSELSKAFGHPNASVLNGGLPGWSAAGGALDTATPVEMEQPLSAYPIPPLDEGVIRSKGPPKCVSLRTGESDLFRLCPNV